MVTKTTTASKRNSEVAEEQAITNNPELVDHDPRGAARNEAILLMKQSNKNEIVTGATCADKRVHEGSPMMDKETKQPKIDLNTGEVMRYSDKHYVTLTFDGGQIETEVTRDQYNLLSHGKRYVCYGRLAPVRVFGQEQILPVYYSFTELY